MYCSRNVIIEDKAYWRKLNYSFNNHIAIEYVQVMLVLIKMFPYEFYLTNILIFQFKTVPTRSTKNAHNKKVLTFYIHNLHTIVSEHLSLKKK